MASCLEHTKKRLHKSYRTTLTRLVQLRQKEGVERRNGLTPRLKLSSEVVFFVALGIFLFFRERKSTRGRGGLLWVGCLFFAAVDSCDNWPFGSQMFDPSGIERLCHRTCCTSDLGRWRG